MVVHSDLPSSILLLFVTELLLIQPSDMTSQKRKVMVGIERIKTCEKYKNGIFKKNKTSKSISTAHFYVFTTKYQNKSTFQYIWMVYAGTFFFAKRGDILIVKHSTSLEFFFKKTGTTVNYN